MHIVTPLWAAHSRTDHSPILVTVAKVVAFGHYERYASDMSDRRSPQIAIARQFLGSVNSESK